AMDDPRVFPRDPRRGASFIDLVIRHTLEGCFSAPEYGGNRDGAGVRLVGLGGDSQPLGYSVFSTTTNDYRELARQPASGPDASEAAGPRPMSREGATIQRAYADAVRSRGGGETCGP